MICYQDMFCYGMFTICNIMFCDALQCYVMMWSFMFCYFMLCHITLCYAMRYGVLMFIMCVSVALRCVRLCNFCLI